MAKLQLEIKNESTREIKSTAGVTVEMTDEIFDSLNKANKVIVNLHEKFIGEVTEVGAYQPDSGQVRYYPTVEVVDALIKVFKLA